MKNKKKMNRAEHNSEHPYTCISNVIIKDKRLNVVETGMMLKLLSDSDEYIFNSTYFIKETGLGKDRYYGALNNLIKLGYINKQRIKGGVLWTINESPNPSEIKKNQNQLELKTTQIEDSPLTITNGFPNNNSLPSATNEKNEKEALLNTSAAILGENEIIVDASFSSKKGISMDEEGNEKSSFGTGKESISKKIEEPSEYASYSTKELRAIFNYIFHDYPKWESDMYSIGINNFLRKTESYFCGESDIIEMFREFEKR